MIILSKKRILFVLSAVLISVFVFTIQVAKNEETVATVSLPVSNKVIVIDARTSENQMNGAESSNRNYGSPD